MNYILSGIFFLVKVKLDLSKLENQKELNSYTNTIFLSKKQKI